MRIAPPIIDRKTARPGLVFQRRLAEGKVTLAAIGAKFDQEARLELSDKVVGEVDMPGPRAEPILPRLKLPGRQPNHMPTVLLMLSLLLLLLLLLGWGLGLGAGARKQMETNVELGGVSRQML
jgi:hypothetical protein